jgi:regulator of protease activity HflC (stomatin/prohibitin superfamily)
MSAKRILGWIFGILAVLVIGLPLLFGWWYTIDEGTRGVVLRNGAVIGIANPGLNFKIPIIDEVRIISIQTHNRRYENVPSYSKDQQPANITISVNYRAAVDRVADIYTHYGSLEGLESRLIDPRLYEQLKNVFGRYTALSAVQDRARLNFDIQKAFTESVQGPLVIESTQIENIDFSEAYEKSIEERMLAEVEVEKLKQNAEREKVQAEITVTKAKAAADAALAEAEAKAKATRLAGEAEAAAIKAKGEALGSNPALIQLTQAERWNGILPTTMIPSGTVPFIDVSKNLPSSP